MTLQMILTDLIPVIALGAIIIGIGAMLAPALAIKGYGVPASGAALDYVRGMGTRDIFLGLALLLNFINWQPHILGWLFFGVALISFVDFLVVLKQRSPIAIGHATGVIVALAYGFWMLLAWS